MTARAGNQAATSGRKRGERGALSPADFRRELAAFAEFGTSTISGAVATQAGIVPSFTNEFWTAKQRAGHPLHEISYRACFKPQLPRFFIERLTRPGDVVYDPFMGRGTTLLEAALLGRRAAGCDINPIAPLLVSPRLNPPPGEEIIARLDGLDLDWSGPVREDLHVFYHPRTLRELTALRERFLQRSAAGTADAVDKWIHMVACNRLTGHSAGFFSVYTLPPNQSVSIASQQKINTKRNQVPEYRDVKALIARKTRRLFGSAAKRAAHPLPPPPPAPPVLLTASCDHTPDLPDGSVDLVVTSPPFLNVVDYATDNWLRAWFCGVDAATVPLWQYKTIGDWGAAMERVFRELRRVLRPGGHIAFETGEVMMGSVCLVPTVVEAGTSAGLMPELVLINQQEFTKTANCWGVDNNSLGTNSNRIALFRKASR